MLGEAIAIRAEILDLMHLVPCNKWSREDPIGQDRANNKKTTDLLVSEQNMNIRQTGTHDRENPSGEITWLMMSISTCGPSHCTVSRTGPTIRAPRPPYGNARVKKTPALLSLSRILGGEGATETWITLNVGYGGRGEISMFCKVTSGAPVTDPGVPSAF